ncbi:MAG: cytochrome c [Rhodocyclaceae bacterium]
MAVLSMAALALAQIPAHAADMRAQIGQKKISMCIGCHGIPGYRTAFPEVYQVPKLGGQHADYIVAALKAYKSGERDHADMRSIANSLSERDMADIAAYYAKVK